MEGPLKTSTAEGPYSLTIWNEIQIEMKCVATVGRGS